MADYKNLYVATEKTMTTTVRRWSDMLCGANEILSNWCMAITVPFYKEYIRGGKNSLTLTTTFDVTTMGMLIQIFPTLMTKYGTLYNITPDRLEILNVNWFFRELVKYKDVDVSNAVLRKD